MSDRSRGEQCSKDQHSHPGSPGLDFDAVLREQKCNSCCNSYYGLSLRDQILKAIDESERALSPLEISDKLHAKPSSTRVILRRLLAQGKIVQPYPGAYCNKITHGVMFNPLRVHNIGLRCCVGEDLEHWEKTEVVGAVKVHVCFGSQRRKISGWISCDAGMSKDACLLAVHRWLDLVEGKLGHSVADLEITSFEQNKDYVGFRLDGVQCVTRAGLFDVIERIYQKEENVIRHEHKVSHSMSLTEFESLLQGGVTGYNATQAAFVLSQKVDQLVAVLKHQNEKTAGIYRLLDALLKHVYSENDAKRSEV